MKVDIKITKGLDENPDAAIIRQKVFVEEQGFTHEFDDVDASAIHLVIYCGRQPVATGRLYDKGCPESKMIGRIAVMKEYRGESLGKKVVGELERIAKADGATTIGLSAQERVKRFYEKLGYKQKGGSYLDEFCPHVLMEKEIAHENKAVT